MIKKSISAIIEKNEYRLKVASSSRFLKNPMMIFDSKMQEADFLSRRLSDSMKKKYTSEENKYLHLIDMLDSLSPLKTLQRGFAIAEKNGKVVESKKDITPGDDLTIRLKDGTIGCTVKENTNE